MLKNIIVLFVLSFVFRLWIASLVPQPFVYDQDEYYGFALGIIKEGLHADIYRLYGYPLIIAPIIYFFGVSSSLPWTIVQSFADSFVSIIVFIIAFRIFRKSTIAWVSAIFYALNPYTAGYTGVLLSEISTIFFLSVISLLVLIIGEKVTFKRIGILVFLLGYIVQVRPSFLYFGFCIVGFVLVYTRRLMHEMRSFKMNMLVIGIFFMPFIYNIVTNIVHYHEFSILSVDKVFERELYTSYFIDRGLAFTDKSWGVWPQEAMQAWGAFSAPKNSIERRIVAQQYKTIVLEKIAQHPLAYIESRMRKMIYVWEKHFIYPYVMGSPSPFVKNLLYWINVIVVLGGISGAIEFIMKRHIASYARLFGIYTLWTILYITLIHTISTSEERFSLPAYPLLYIFLGYVVHRCSTQVRRLIGKYWM